MSIVRAVNQSEPAPLFELATVSKKKSPIFFGVP